MPPQAETTASTRQRWIPGEPFRPIAFHVLDAMRVRNLPANRAASHACDQRETQEEADGLACPACGAPIGTRCFGPDARCNHPVRAMAHWDADSLQRTASDATALSPHGLRRDSTHRKSCAHNLVDLTRCEATLRFDLWHAGGASSAPPRSRPRASPRRFQCNA